MGTSKNYSSCPVTHGRIRVEACGEATRLNSSRCSNPLGHLDESRVSYSPKCQPPSDSTKNLSVPRLRAHVTVRGAWSTGIQYPGKSQENTWCQTPKGRADRPPPNDDMYPSITASCRLSGMGICLRLSACPVLLGILTQNYPPVR